MKTITNFTRFSFVFAMITLLSCSDREALIFAPEPELPVQTANYSTPDHAGTFWIDVTKYHVTDDGATLGRVLFYDKILSKNNTVSCGSCHSQQIGFADPVPFSEGINAQLLTRHTPAISNCYDDEFLFWDGRSANLQDLALKPVRNHKEMGLDETEFMIAKINKAPYYDALFASAFGDGTVTEERIADALSQFLGSMISGNSKYDRSLANEDTLSQIEFDGQAVFFGQGRCYQCHSGQDFNTRGGFFGGWGPSRANIGLDEEYSDDGFGVFDSDALGEFKIPTLRNIAVTAPYMHDGRFETLTDVVNHYNENIADHPNLSSELQDWNTDGPARLNLSDYQVSTLVKFLGTLTDEVYLSDPKFADPFK
jgi:cytochrome c peroxidase